VFFTDQRYIQSTFFRYFEYNKNKEKPTEANIFHWTTIRSISFPRKGVTRAPRRANTSDFPKGKVINYRNKIIVFLPCWIINQIIKTRPLFRAVLNSKLTFFDRHGAYIHLMSFFFHSVENHELYLTIF